MTLPRELHLTPQACTIHFQEQESRTFLYTEVPELRAAVQDFVAATAEQHRHSLFKDHCGRCGNSCRRSDVLVREHELLPLLQHLGVSENGFRQRYLNPAQTWNPGDGLIRLENGSCPFLQGSPGAPLSTSCSIHSLRPQNCRDYRSDKPHCAKDTGLLVERLQEIWLSAESTRILLDNGDLAIYLTREEDFLILAQAAAQATPVERHRHERLHQELRGVLDGLLDNFDLRLVDDLYRENCLRLRRNLEILLSVGPSAALEETWTRLRRLERMVDRPDQPVLPPNARTEWLHLQESGLQLRWSGHSDVIPLLYSWNPKLSEPVAALLQAVLQLAEDPLQQALQPTPAHCYMCGECCGFYAIEVKPSDIHRLCEFLAIPPSKFVEEYTVAARFGWNKFGRILNKVEGPVYSKDLKSLRVIGQEQGHSLRRCVFLERKEDGFFYCSVHSHKPDACRAYQPDTALCRNTNQRDNWGRALQHLSSLEITPSQVIVHLDGGRAQALPRLIVEGPISSLEECLVAELGHLIPD